MGKRNFKKETTGQFACKRCGEKKMYPNESDGHVKGYVCTCCKEVNHPVRDVLTDAELRELAAS